MVKHAGISTQVGAQNELYGIKAIFRFLLNFDMRLKEVEALFGSSPLGYQDWAET
jgi:hypothetical protein